MGKRGRGYQKKKNEDDDKISRKVSRSRSNNDEHDMDDEIDVFHKQRDKVQLDMKDDFEESDEDSEVPVLDMEDINDEEEEEEDEEDDDDDNDDDDDDDDEDADDVVRKIIKTKKYLNAKLGGVDDDMHEDEEDDNHAMVWDRRLLHSADNRKFELLSSDDEAPEEEEKEARAIQMKRVENFTMEDLGLEDEVPGNDKELTLEEMSTERKSAMRFSDNDTTMDDLHAPSLDVNDLNALSKEEQLEVLHSTAPELVVLLSELDEALEQLESKINPFLTKVKSGEIVVEGGIGYFEVKQLLLLLYCQAISFYLLLMSEGQPVRDHPVIARLVELKNLLDQMKELDERLPIKLEDILQQKNVIETSVKLGNNVDKSENASSGKVNTMMEDPLFLRNSEEATAMPACKEDKLHKLKKGDMIEVKKHLEQNNQVGKQSLDMLKVREALEKKLKEKGVFKSISSKSEKFQKQSRFVNGKLETYDDFDDVAVSDGRSNNPSNDLSSTIVSKLLRTTQSKSKVISGDDDLPKRDDIGERRRKFEVQVLARAGIKSEDDIGNGFDGPHSHDDTDMDEDENHESGEDELYKQAEQRLAAKRSAKSQAYTRKPPLASLAEIVDGKRHISYQMEKNRGLTRPRNKLTKNPRKKYKLKHQKAVKRLQGRVPNLKQQSGVYSGELHGINAAVSKSVRLKS